ncbi:MAG: tRNA uridine-5-carboxymethylaminomethyl(34) synthesis GTPase MnmE [Alistipes sp.]|nr:tRNA uridine-5-carboxymethylaminomethyl(34) synthesis GTPase MnmE [Alistipes sp.]
MNSIDNDTIVAVATGRGGAIAIIRMSGPHSIALCDRLFAARGGRSLREAAGYTVHFGELRDGVEVVDEVLVTVFRAPHSYTGEESVEISCHASPYIENSIVQLLIAEGARAATPGEFTVRAFLAGKLDLAQAEAVADLIASSDRAGHALAMGQMRGGVSSALASLRAELVELAALLELELDFSEEDVEFASRERLAALAETIGSELDTLAGSFALGNAIREGVPVAIVGRPNAGKSTLLNALAGDDRAMVSEIAGTTRDRIEERVNIGGVGFRFIDTAGLRDTDDVLERMGIDRTLDAIRGARVVLLILDAAELGVTDVTHVAGVTDATHVTNVTHAVEAQVSGLGLRGDQRICVVFNKADLCSPVSLLPSLSSVSSPVLAGVESLAISAKTGLGLSELRAWLAGAVDTAAIEAGAAVVSSSRHYEALTRAREGVRKFSAGLVAGLSADLLAEDVREVLYHLGLVTGAVTTDDLLATIFSKFCIGK